MRVNIYSQEITNEVHTVVKESNTGVSYSAVQFMLHSATELHAAPDDDDRSAVTFWLPKSDVRREALAKVFEKAAEIVRTAPSETGLD